MGELTVSKSVWSGKGQRKRYQPILSIRIGYLGGLCPLQQSGQWVAFAALRLGAGHSHHRPALLHASITHGFDVNQEGPVLASCHACSGRRMGQLRHWWTDNLVADSYKKNIFMSTKTFKVKFKETGRCDYHYLWQAWGWLGWACLRGQRGPAHWPAILDHTGCPPCGPLRMDTAQSLQQAHQSNTNVH